MRERPILFSPDMVRAIIEGRKTQTRRVLTLAEPYRWVPVNPTRAVVKPDGMVHWFEPGLDQPVLATPPCPYGLVGDRLWVREAWYPAFKKTSFNNGCVYRADDDGYHISPGWSPRGHGKGWRSPMHMPRWASRITLHIAEVRVERLSDISSEDAQAEGYGGRLGFLKGEWASAKVADNPWVWVITFKRVP